MQVICVTELKFTSLIENKKTYLAYIPAAILTVGIAIVSLLENPNLPAMISAKDKLIHGFMYFLLAEVWMIPIRRRFPARIMPYVYVWTAVVGYGALMEILQRFCTLTRSGEMVDLYADAIGALIGVAFVAVVQLTMPKDKDIPSNEESAL